MESKIKSVKANQRGDTLGEVILVAGAIIVGSWLGFLVGAGIHFILKSW